MTKIIKLRPTVVDECISNAVSENFSEIMIIGQKDDQLFFAHSTMDIDLILGRLLLLQQDLLNEWSTQNDEEM
jgi:hypothetical protein